MMSYSYDFIIGVCFFKILKMFIIKIFFFCEKYNICKKICLCFKVKIYLSYLGKDIKLYVILFLCELF